MTHTLKSALLPALITVLLALPLAGLQLQDLSGKNGLNIRPLWVIVPAIIVFIGHCLLQILRDRHTVKPSVGRPSNKSALIAHISPRLFLMVGVVAIVFPLLPFTSRYELDLATTFLIYVMLGWGLNIVVGMAGLLDLGYVAFYAAGAYTFGYLSVNYGISFWAALPLCGLVAASLGFLLGFPVLRLRGDYLAIVTLGFGEIIRIFLINLTDVTGGPNGIAGIARPTFFGHPFVASVPDGTMTFADIFHLDFSADHRIAWLYYIILGLVALTFLLTERLRRLPIGRSWEALREDETACQAVGINPTSVKLTAFTLGAMLGGFAGCFFAARQGFISPESFTFTESAIILAIVVLGGMGSQLGVLLAAVVLVGLPELGREFAEYRMLLFGLAMVFIMIWRPQGLIAGRKPSILAPAELPNLQVSESLR
ncbi:high-affinity branched-chain amino acid ABC transporter permease LivM [Pseudomonas silesiensis]|uniref:high-affinity branched-chain amino acid ABC transporter permease LivM n=1 Tax=Pseudomonas silesiensis TaxID=1853130 RepID=UPI0022B26BF6|nr:high-affinity branched-chain amino acid ABC transporter permease LivM [Pseudomonas silesiensis]